jgi:hypothetical protein
MDDAADRIIRGAIARKHALFTAIHDYSANAHVKFVVRDLARPPDSAQSIVLISETRSRTYWQQPDHYQETILSRRQTSNLNADRNLVTVGEIANFHRERIDFQRFVVVSPIADDALSHYRYRLLDTLALDGHRTFRLAIEPRSDATPLFVGTIDIVDSSYDIAGIDVGFDRAVHFTALRDLRYRQRSREATPGRWMPYEIELDGNLHLAIPVPRMPRDLAFQHIAELTDFQFDQGNPPADLAEVRVIVAPSADRPDSAGWAKAAAALPLSAAEGAAWQRIDSLQQQPPGFGALVRRDLAASIRVLDDPDYFHFNRAEGAYAGLGHAWRPDPGLLVHAKLGYATGSDEVEYEADGNVRLSEAQRTWIGLGYHDDVVARPTFVSDNYNATMRALLFRADPLDYYRQRGMTVSWTTKLVDFTRVDVQYDDELQSTLPTVTEFSLFPRRRVQRPNLPIVPGHLRTVSATLAYDSRPLRRRGVRDERLARATWTAVSLSAEVAAPSLIPNDFAYRRYVLRFQRRQQTLGLGITTLAVVAGTSAGELPPQRYFTVDVGMKALTYQSTGFNTLGDTNFAGNRAVMVAIQHDFDRLLFAKSHLPLIKRIPFTFSVHAAAFWTEFVDHVPQAADSLLRVAPHGFGEVGFGLGNLTPFLSPFNLAAHFSWSLSPGVASGQRFRVGFSVFDR